MKTFLFSAVATALGMAAIYFTLGGPAMAVALIALAGLGLLVAGVAIGSGWSARLMERGANIALQAQVSDDRRDTALIRAITDSGKNWIRVRDQATEEARSQYPALPVYVSQPESGGGFAGAGFTIDGFEEDQFNKGD